MIFLQHDRGPLFFRQFRHRALDQPAEILPRNQIFDRLRRLSRRREIQQIDILRCLHHGRPPLAANPVAAQIERDPIQPRRELRLPAKPGKRAKGTEKGLLTHVARVFFASNRAVREREDGAFPPQNELVEAVGIAANGFRDELFIGRRHAERRDPLSQ